MDRLCINCKYLNSDWHIEPCRSCVTKTRPNFEPNSEDDSICATINGTTYVGSIDWSKKNN